MPLPTATIATHSELMQQGVLSLVDVLHEALSLPSKLLLRWSVTAMLEMKRKSTYRVSTTLRWRIASRTHDGPLMLVCV